MQARRSMEPRRHSGLGRSDREGLIRAFDEEEGVGSFSLNDLAEDSEDDAPIPLNGKANGHPKKSFTGSERTSRQSRGP